MKLVHLLVWLAFVLPLYGFVNIYILRRGLRALDPPPPWRKAIIALFAGCALSYWIARALESVHICAASGALFWIGSYWFAVFAYLGLFSLTVDLFRLSNRIRPWFPRAITDNYRLAGRVLAALALALTALLITAGRYNALHPVVTTVEFDIPKRVAGRHTLDIALVTDIHLGTIIRNGDVRRLARLVDSFHPDLVILGGDVLDEDVAPVLHYGIGKDLSKITTRYRTFAVTGNHEYYGGLQKSLAYLQSQGIDVLVDRWVRVNGITIVGRDDRTRDSMGPSPRRQLKDIMRGIDRSSPVLLVSHQPVGFDEARAEGADVMLSGHTHRGQIWPFTLVTDAIYRVSHGIEKMGTMSAYVSCGFGTWGPPVRLGTVPEVVHLRLKFESRK